MVDYDFYVNSYLGSALSKGAFPSLSAQAAWELERLKRLYRVEGGEQAEKLAMCAMAEVIAEYQKQREGITSASVGAVSVHYEHSPGKENSLRRQLYQRAAIYLDIYRGVGA